MAALGLAAFAPRAARADTVIPAGISTNTTLTLANSPYVLVTTTVHNGATLTIEPGVVIRASSASSVLEVGTSYEAGALQALGTAGQRIVFTSLAGTPGSWVGIVFGGWSATKTSLMTYCDVLNGGGSGDAHAACVNVSEGPWGALNTQPTLEDCSIEGSGKYGLVTYGNSQVTLTRVHFEGNANTDFLAALHTDGLASVFTNCTFVTGSHLGIDSYGSRVFAAQLSGCTFTGTGDYGLRVAASVVDHGAFTTSGYAVGVRLMSSGIAANRRWSPPGPGQAYAIESVLDGGVIVEGGATLTIDPGVVVKGMDVHSALRVGAGQYGAGALQALGTQAEPIVFTSLSGLPGGWRGVVFTSGSASMSSLMRWCEVRNGGSGGAYNANAVFTDGGLWGAVNLQPTLEDCTIAGSAKYGFLAYVNAQPTLTRVHFENNANTDCVFEYDNVHGLSPALTGCTFDTGTHLGLDVWGYSPNDNAPRLTACTFTGTGEYGLRVPPLSIDDGTFTTAGYTKGVRVTPGSIAAPRRWRVPGPGQIYAFDNYGALPWDEGGVFVNGGATWTIDPGVTIKAISTNGTGRITVQNGVVRAIGTASQPILFTSVAGTPGTWQGIAFEGTPSGTSRFEYCTITNGTESNLRVYSGPTGNPELYKCSLTNATQRGLRLEWGTPTLSYCSITGNGLNAGDSWGTAIADARNCWWGHATGPYDNSFGPPLYNPGGLGQPIGDYIDYGSWRSAPPCLTTRAITASAGAGGSISPPGVTNVYCDTPQAYTITPDACQHVVDVVVDGASKGPIAAWTFPPDDPLTSHTISATFAPNPPYTISASAGTGGSITPAGGVPVPCGTNQTFDIAVTDACYALTDVIVDSESRGPVPSWTFENVQDNHTISATFTLRTFAVEIAVVGSGTVTRAPDLAFYDCGSAVSLTAAPATGWHFTGWSGDAGGTANPLEVTVSAARAITATFEINRYALNLAVVGSGAVGRAPDQALYDHGTTVTLTPAGDPCWQFTGWSGDATGSDQPLQVVMTAARSITATFEQPSYALTTDQGTGGGTITPPGPVMVACGGSQTFTITPADCHEIAEVRVDGVSQGAITSYTFTNVAAPHAIVALFRKGSAPVGSLQAWWNFDERSLPVVYDLLHRQPDANTGSLTGGASIVPGMVGEGMNCSLGADGMVISGPNRITLISNLSVDAWILLRPGSPTDHFRSIVRKLDRAGNNAFAFYVRDRYLKFTMERGFDDPVTSAERLSLGVWHHVAVTADLSLGIRLFVDGVQVGSRPAPSGGFDCGRGVEPIYVGRDPWGVHAFNGLIDEVDIGRGVLTQGVAAARCAGKALETVRIPTATEECQPPAETQVCARITHLYGEPQTYQWTVEAVACPLGGMIPLSFSPSSGTVTLERGHRDAFDFNVATISGSGCYRVIVTNLATGNTTIARGTVLSSATAGIMRAVCREPYCSPPVLAHVTQGGGRYAIQGTEETASFTLQNDGDTPFLFAWQIEALDGDTDGPSTVVSLDGQSPGTPVGNAVMVPAHGTAQVSVNVSVFLNSPMLTDQLLLSGDTNGDYVLEPLQSLFVEAQEDSIGVPLGVESETGAPAMVRLAVMPNPARGPLDVRLALPAEGRTDVGVFDVAGRKVRSLHDGPLTAGIHDFQWDGRNAAGAMTGAGIYFIRIRVEGLDRRLEAKAVRIR